MASVEVYSQSYLLSTDLGICMVKLMQVQGYDVEDIVRDRAVSQARAVSMMYLGKRINPNMPVTPRTLNSVWKNNEMELS